MVLETTNKISRNMEAVAKENLEPGSKSGTPPPGLNKLGYGIWLVVLVTVLIVFLVLISSRSEIEKLQRNIDLLQDEYNKLQNRESEHNNVMDHGLGQQLYKMVSNMCATNLFSDMMIQLKDEKIPGNQLVFAARNMQAENGVLVYKKDSWEVIRSHVTIEKFLGGGSFGDVYQGFIKDVGSQAQRPCAIKMVKQAATKEDKTEFLNEANIMKAFDANHVVKLLGVVSVGEPTMILMELMPRGSLLNYLDSCRLKSKSPTQERILQMSAEIADGMAYLADKKYVHRDLAARNCMVADDLTVKVGDFGLTRHIYEKDYYRIGPNGPKPIRWMAPESLRHGVFTSSSDVWSYGVLLWEMATGGMIPYFAKFRNDEVLNFVEEGGTLDRPDNCPDCLYSLMHRCWAFNPEDRPTFMEILAYLEPYTNPNFPKVSYYHSDAAKENNKIRKSSKAALSSKAASDALENINLFRHVLPALM